MFKIAICDDDIHFLDTFERILYKEFSDRGQAADIHKYASGKALIDHIEKGKQLYQIIFLDVEMPDVSGFQVAARLQEINTGFLLLFTTLMEHQSREGYLYGAYRYIFKNNLETEITEAVSSILKKLANSASGSENVTFKYRNSGVLDDLTIQKDNILYLKREKNRRVILKTVVSEYELLVKPLSEYGQMLDFANFYPLMRNFIVNFNHVQELDDDYFILTGGARVPLGIKREVKKVSRDKYLLFLQEHI